MIALTVAVVKNRGRAIRVTAAPKVAAIHAKVNGVVVLTVGGAVIAVAVEMTVATTGGHVAKMHRVVVLVKVSLKIGLRRRTQNQRFHKNSLQRNILKTISTLPEKCAKNRQQQKNASALIGPRMKVANTVAAVAVAVAVDDAMKKKPHLEQRVQLMNSIRQLNRLAMNPMRRRLMPTRNFPPSCLRPKTILPTTIAPHVALQVIAKVVKIVVRVAVVAAVVVVVGTKRPKRRVQRQPLATLTAMIRIWKTTLKLIARRLPLLAVVPSVNNAACRAKMTKSMKCCRLSWMKMAAKAMPTRKFQPGRKPLAC